MELLDKLVKTLEEMPEQICDTGTIYDIYETPTENEMVDALKIIVEHNKKVISNIKKSNQEFREQISNARKKEKQQTPIEEPDIVEKTKKHINVSQKIEVILANDEEKAKKYISTLTEQEILYIKLEIYKKIKNIEEQIQLSIMDSTLNDISNYQNELLKLKIIIELFKKQDEKEEKLEIETNNIILLPNKKNSSYLLHDIQEFPEQINEIKTVIDKVFSGYFTFTKDNRSINNADVKLSEYKSKTGIRVMYIVLPNNKLLIVSLFYKDKQKSTKITGYYEEAERRFAQSKDQLEEYMLEENFSIEQAELMGKVTEYLEAHERKNKRVLK